MGFKDLSLGQDSSFSIILTSHKIKHICNPEIFLEKLGEFIRFVLVNSNTLKITTIDELNYSIFLAVN